MEDDEGSLRAQIGSSVPRSFGPEGTPAAEQHQPRRHLSFSHENRFFLKLIFNVRVPLERCRQKVVCVAVSFIINTDYGTTRFYEKGDYLARASCAQALARSL